jgi:hypothetical protein
MGVLKPRKRMVSLRLSEDEYQDLLELTARQGAHSTSDLARTAICDFLNTHSGPTGRRGPFNADLVSKVAQLQGEVRRLGRLLDGKSSVAGVGAKK